MEFEVTDVTFTGPNTASMHAVDAGMLGAAGLTVSLPYAGLIAQREENG
jgi:hypothetical protein